MTGRDVPESDWKIFRRLREVALERFCARILAEVDVTCRDSARTPHERYLKVWGLIQDRNREIGKAFDNPRRSDMLLQLKLMRDLGLMEPDELAGFTSETQRAIGPA